MERAFFWVFDHYLPLFGALAVLAVAVAVRIGKPRRWFLVATAERKARGVRVQGPPHHDDHRPRRARPPADHRRPRLRGLRGRGPAGALNLSLRPVHLRSSHEWEAPAAALSGALCNHIG